MIAVVLARIPDGAPTPEDFDVVDAEAPGVGEGEVRLAVRSLSLDPYQRGSLGGLGDVPPGRAVGEVLESRCPEVEVDGRGSVELVTHRIDLAISRLRR